MDEPNPMPLLTDDARHFVYVTTIPEAGPEAVAVWYDRISSCVLAVMEDALEFGPAMLHLGFTHAAQGKDSK